MVAQDVTLNQISLKLAVGLFTDAWNQEPGMRVFVFGVGAKRNKTRDSRRKTATLKRVQPLLANIVASIALSQRICPLRRP